MISVANYMPLNSHYSPYIQILPQQLMLNQSQIFPNLAFLPQDGF
jgi:hypothetical protein